MRFSPILGLALLAIAAACQAQDAADNGTDVKPAKASGFKPTESSAMALSPTQHLAAYAPETGGVQMPAPSEPAAPKYDYSANIKSDVFGAKMFTGGFVQRGAIQFNPDYLIAAGDQLAVRFWGGFNFESVFPVDPQGNIFVPQVGPIHVLGVRNKDLQQVVESQVRTVFRSNVSVYASLAKAEPVRVFVGGYVNHPGLYNGTSMDSVLHYLDRAGGIDPDRGSFLQVQVKRGEQVRASVDLYDFLLKGTIPLVQLGDGDVVFVGPRLSTVKVSGAAENANRFEFKGKSVALSEVLALAKPLPEATNVRVIRNAGPVRNTEYYPLASAASVWVDDGDEVNFTTDKKPGTITVRVEGEHMSPQEYVLPYGAHMSALLGQIRLSQRSDIQNIQLFRQSVQERQKALLDTSLQNLQASVLTARSGTAEEAQLRKDEAALVLQWVERAKTIVPRGQVVISKSANRDELALENGDVIRIPAKSQLVLVSGEVLFPNAVAYDRSFALSDYLRLSGGLTQQSSSSRIVIAHPDGSFDDSANDDSLHAGDEIMVLPKVDVKSRQILKEVSQIMYQIAISAKVALDL